jgi:DNA-binding beta-propeller fold protein YncE
MRAKRAHDTPSFYFFLAALCLGEMTSGCTSCKRSSKAEGKLTQGGTIAMPPHRAAYITNNGSDSISVLDRDAVGSVTTVLVDLEPDAREAPHHLAIDRNRKNVFVALAFPPEPGKKRNAHSAHGNSSEVGQLARLDLSDLSVREVTTVDENPGDVVLSHDGSRALVTHFDMKRAMDVAAKGGASPATMFAQLVVVDTRTMKRIVSRPVCTAPHGVVTTRDDKTAFIACYGSDEVAIVDLASEGLPTTRIPLGASPGVPGVPRYGPYSVTLSPDERRVIVATLEGQDVRVLDLATRRFVPELAVTLAAKAFMPAFLDDKTLLVPTQSPDGIVSIDLERSRVEARARFSREECTLPHAAKMAKDGRIYVVCEGDHVAPGTVLELDRATLRVKGRWSVGVYPDGIEFAD